MSSSPSPQRAQQVDARISQNAISITKKEDMKSIFRNQVDSLKIVRQTTAELANLSKVSQAKQRAVRDNYDQQLQNFKKIRKDLEVLHKSIVKVMVCEERIQLIKSKQENEKKAKEVSDKPDILELGYGQSQYNETKLSEYLSDVIVFGDQEQLKEKEQQKEQNERRNDASKVNNGLDQQKDSIEKAKEEQSNENKDVIKEEKEQNHQVESLDQKEAEVNLHNEDTINKTIETTAQQQVEVADKQNEEQPQKE